MDFARITTAAAIGGDVEELDAGVDVVGSDEAEPVGVADALSETVVVTDIGGEVGLVGVLVAVELELVGADVVVLGADVVVDGTDVVVVGGSLVVVDGADVVVLGAEVVVLGGSLVVAVGGVRGQGWMPFTGSARGGVMTLRSAA